MIIYILIIAIMTLENMEGLSTMDTRLMNPEELIEEETSEREVRRFISESMCYVY